MAKKKGPFRGKLGTGTRFKNCVVSVMKKNKWSKERAEGVCASIGRKKYGKAKFQKMSVRGRKK